MATDYYNFAFIYFEQGYQVKVVIQGTVLMQVPHKKLKMVSIMILYSIMMLAVSICFIKRRHIKNYEKCFLFHQNSSFYSSDMHIIVLPNSPLFPLHAVAEFIGETN